MDGNYNFVTLSTVAMVIVDIAADLYVVKYINGGLFMIGLATTAGHVIACLIVLSHFLLKKSLFHFNLLWGSIMFIHYFKIIIFLWFFQ